MKVKRFLWRLTDVFYWAFFAGVLFSFICFIAMRDRPYRSFGALTLCFAAAMVLAEISNRLEEYRDV